MIIGVVMQVLVLGYITLKTDWDEQVNPRDSKWHVPSSASTVSCYINAIRRIMISLMLSFCSSLFLAAGEESVGSPEQVALEPLRRSY